MSFQLLQTETQHPPNEIVQLFETFEFWPFKVERVFIKYWYIVIAILYLILTFLSMKAGSLFWFDPNQKTYNFAFGATILMALAYTYWHSTITDTLKTIFTSGSISYTNGNLQNEYVKSLRDYQNDLMSKKRYILICILLGGISLYYFLLSPILFQWLLLQNNEWASIFIILITGILTPLFGAYFCGVVCWTMFITGLFIRKIPRKFQVNIRPFHPDQCGGLKFLGDFSINMALPILIGITTLSIITLYYMLDTNTSLASVRLAILGFIALFLFAIPLAFLTFLGPLWEIHKVMLNHRRQYEDQFAERIFPLIIQLNKYIDTKEFEKVKELNELIDILQRFAPDKANHPIWPFDRRMFLGFVTPQVVSILIPIVGLLKNFVGLN